MKRPLFLLSVLFLLLCGCSPELSEEGIEPYALSEDQQQLLSAFDMTDTSYLVSFLAPEEAITMEVNAYRLTDTGTWVSIGQGAMSIGTERLPVSQLSGTIAMELTENYGIDFHISCAGLGSFSTEEIQLDTAPVGSTKGYLTEFEPITLNKEIPIAIMVYDSGTSMRSYTPQDYYDPSVLEGMDLVQVVTVQFSDTEMDG